MPSPRSDFQVKYFRDAPHNPVEPQILNIGSADDPLHFGSYAMHVDIDDWSLKHEHFIHTDAASLPIPDQSYHTVILGDMLEHVVGPYKVVSEAARVCSNTLVLTVFEEWRLPGHGQFIEIGQRLGDEESRRLGYADREDYQVKNFPLRKGFDDNEVPHLIHINQFKDSDIDDIIEFTKGLGFEVLEYMKEPEAVQDEHQWYNWLVAFRRTR